MIMTMSCQLVLAFHLVALERLMFWLLNLFSPLYYACVEPPVTQFGYLEF